VSHCKFGQTLVIHSYFSQLKQNNLGSSELECAIPAEEWNEYVKLRKKRVNHFTVKLSLREIELLDKGIIAENWEWIFLNYHNVHLYMS
jgi:hypothetical protein